MLLGAIRLYRMLLSPLIHACFGPVAGCRFHPTCSAYAIEAVQRHGAARGAWLAVARLCRCHPWGPSGADPVPEALTRQRRRAARTARPSADAPLIAR